MFGQIVGGFVGILIAFLLVKYRYQIQEIFGSFSWAERYLGSTEAGILGFSILLFIWALLYMTGSLNGIIVNTFGRLF